MKGFVRPVHQVLNLSPKKWLIFLPCTASQTIMKDIYAASIKSAKEYNTNLQGGANIAGFLKVADAMLAQGVF